MRSFLPVILPVLFLVPPRCCADQPAEMRMKAPELTNVTEWINTKPLKLADLHGKVTVLHFWTFG